MLRWKRTNRITGRHRDGGRLPRKAREWIKSPEISKQEIITLSDGTRANYIEITWKYRWFDMLTVAVVAYRDDKFIGTAAVGTGKMAEGYLAGMAKSLRFNK